MMEAMLAIDPALRRLASSTAYPGLRLLVLFGSRARSEAGAGVLFESPAGQFQRFWVEAVSFWCDAAPVLERAYAGVLEMNRAAARRCRAGPRAIRRRRAPRAGDTIGFT